MAKYMRFAKMGARIMNTSPMMAMIAPAPPESLLDDLREELLPE
jgi:hypothetical protein